MIDLVTVLLMWGVLGLLPAVIASRRVVGQSFFGWWIYGALIFPVALIHSFLVRPGSTFVTLKPQSNRSEDLKARMDAWHAQRDRRVTKGR